MTVGCRHTLELLGGSIVSETGGVGGRIVGSMRILGDGIPGTLDGIGGSTSGQADALAGSVSDSMSLGAILVGEKDELVVARVRRDDALGEEELAKLRVGPRVEGLVLCSRGVVLNRVVGGCSSTR